MGNSNKLKEKIFVTQPFLPPLEEYVDYLEKIWAFKHLTNNGPFHQQFEKELASYLGVKYVSLINNATTALLVSIKALDLTGEVITTPYSFVATAHSILWNRLTPVFVDIDPSTCNIDPDKIEKAITSNTSAILPVHVYGNPCETKKIKDISEKYGLNVIYDAAHAFAVDKNGKSILTEGDLSVLSFHATKVFNTFEGGAIVSHTAEMKKKIDNLKNFGFQDQITVEGIGINGKMNEAQASMGLLQLKYIDSAIEKRKKIAKIYREGLREVNGISFLDDMEGVKHNYAYFPIFINEQEYGMSRDYLFEELKKHNIYSRKYFYPLISQFTAFINFLSSKTENLPIAEKMSSKVLCLPIYPDLDQMDVKRVIEILKTL
jgi:dTDP-4-amino-4,6-dideoxygalactose transaminase